MDGPPLSGKRSLAHVFASALLCTGEGERPCGRCGACHRSMQLQHPDLHILDRGSGATIGVDDIRTLQRETRLRAYEGGRTVVVIVHAHRMTVQAQNAFLKTLEEPAGDTVAILLCENTTQMLATILSRCVVLRMQRVAEARIRDLLIAGGHSDAPRAALCAALSDGRVGRAYALAADEAYWAKSAQALQVLGELARGRGLAQAMQFLQAGRQDVDELLLRWQCALRDALVQKAGAQIAALGLPVPPAVSALDAQRLEDLLRACMDTRRVIAANANVVPAMDALLIGIFGGTTICP